MPAKFREILGDQFVVTRGFDGCLFVFAEDGWNAFEEKLQALPMDNPDARVLSRFFLAGATDAETDKQGRILIPAPLLKHACIEKEAVIAGVGNRVEIWNKDNWENASTFEDINDILPCDVDSCANVKGKSWTNLEFSVFIRGACSAMQTNFNRICFLCAEANY